MRRGFYIIMQMPFKPKRSIDYGLFCGGKYISTSFASIRHRTVIQSIFIHVKTNCEKIFLLFTTASMFTDKINERIVKSLYQ